MEQSTSENTLKQVLAALEYEKAQLQEQLETELEDSERQEIETRVGEICADLEIQKIGLFQPPSQVETEVRRSEREKHPTEKMLEFKRTEITKKERKFMSRYVNFKAEVQLTRSKLKEECSKTELSEMFKSVEKCESELKQEYESLRALTMPSQDIRRKMDSCTSVTTEITLLLKSRYADVDIKEFDSSAVKESLLQLLQREDAKSIYGSTVSRAGLSSQQSHSQEGSHVTAKKADAAARLASKRAEINREMEISAQRKEVLAQQEKLKLLEEQRDLEVIEAEYNVYAEEESKLNAEIRDIEVKSTLFVKLAIFPKIVVRESLVTFAGEAIPLRFMRNALKEKGLKHHHKRTVLPLFHAV
nr:ELKS/Rab6-interacting/CAST family member 1-like [Labrus bergylta]